MISGVVAARSAVAPAGGWIVFVIPMKADVRPTERAPAIQRRFSKFGFSWKSFVMPTPVMDAKTWPRIAFLGWASGESIVLYSRIAAAPWDKN